MDSGREALPGSGRWIVAGSYCLVQVTDQVSVMVEEIDVREVN